MECPELNEYGSLDQCSQTGAGWVVPSFCWVVKLTGSVRLCVSRVKQASTGGGALLAPSPLQQYPLTFINQASASNL